MKVIPLSKYCEITGLKKESILKRLERGIWRLGVQVLKLRGIKEYHIDTEAVDKWARDKQNHID